MGIGRASANQFAQNGARAIYLCDFRTENLASQQRELGSLYPDVQIHIRQLDAADEAAIKAVTEEAVAEYGRLDVMFANAGITGALQHFLDVSSEEFMKTMRTNVLRQVISSFTPWFIIRKIINLQAITNFPHRYTVFFLRPSMPQRPCFTPRLPSLPPQDLSSLRPLLPVFAAMAPPVNSLALTFSNINPSLFLILILNLLIRPRGKTSRLLRIQSGRCLHRSNDLL